MNRLTLLAAASLLLAPAPRLLAQAPDNDQPPPQRLMRGDVSGTVNWVSINKSDARSYNDWHSQFGVSGGMGWYWTDHHKTQVDFAATTAASVYSSQPYVVGPQQQTFVTTVRSYESQRVSLIQLYQFRRNEWVHPFLGAGIDIVREQSSGRDDPIFWYDQVLRQSRLARDSVRYGEQSKIAARAVLTTGVKAYFSRKVFALTDLRVNVSSHRAEDMQWRFGLGADF
jgi:hypothetical protein